VRLRAEAKKSLFYHVNEHRREQREWSEAVLS
jgi:hypothetical protein